MESLTAEKVPEITPSNCFFYTWGGKGPEQDNPQHLPETTQAALEFRFWTPQLQVHLSVAQWLEDSRAQKAGQGQCHTVTAREDQAKRGTTALSKQGKIENYLHVH